jgi:hypothetical protein
MNLRKLFGIKSKGKEPYQFADFLHMWDDDHLMVELIPKENLGFIKTESKRIDNFGKEHFNGNGFAEITEIGEIQIKTLDKEIDFNSVSSIFNKKGMKRIEKVAFEGKALTEENIPFGFGSNKFAVLLENENDKLKYIWTTGRIENEELRNKFENAVSEFVKKYDFIAVDWYKPEYFELRTENEIKEFIKNSC